MYPKHEAAQTSPLCSGQKAFCGFFHSGKEPGCEWRAGGSTWPTAALQASGSLPCAQPRGRFPSKASGLCKRRFHLLPGTEGVMADTVLLALHVLFMTENFADHSI